MFPIFFHTTKGPEAPRIPVIQSYSGEQSVLECEVISFSLWSPFSFSLGWATSHMVLETGSHFLRLGVSPRLIFTNDSSPFYSGEGVTCFLILLGSCFRKVGCIQLCLSAPTVHTQIHMCAFALWGHIQMQPPSDASNSNLKSYVSVFSTAWSQEGP